MGLLYLLVRDVDKKMEVQTGEGMGTDVWLSL
jgi:hypothetical protein